MESNSKFEICADKMPISNTEQIQIVNLIYREKMKFELEDLECDKGNDE